MAESRAQILRKNLTEAEKRLWWRLRRRQVESARFRRQAPIGRYIVDFVCFEERLVVELDGGQHAIDTESDERRTRWLERQGFRVLRFWNHEVLINLDGVVTEITDALAKNGDTPLPDPPPQGGREEG